MSNRIKLYDILDNTKSVYMSSNSLEVLLDYERVLDFTDLYVFENWSGGELIEGPLNTRYFVECSFMWPKKLMPNPVGARRLLDYGIKIDMRESQLVKPVPKLHAIANDSGRSKAQIETPDEQQSNKIEVEMLNIWIATIIIPKRLMNDIERGYIELQGDKIDLDDVERSEDENLEQASLMPSAHGDGMGADDKFENEL